MIKDDNSTGQIKRMIASIDRFIEAWNEFRDAWNTLMRECRFLCEASMRSEYFRMNEFMQSRTQSQYSGDIQYLKDMALSLEKELRQIQ